MNGGRLYVYFKQPWYGNIAPRERYIRSNTGYQKLSDEPSIKLTDFVKKLSVDGRKQYEAIENLRLRLNYISEDYAFIVGFRLGARKNLNIVWEYDVQFEALQRFNTKSINTT